MVDSMVTSIYTKKNNVIAADHGSEVVAGDHEKAITSGGGVNFHGHHHGQKGPIGQQLLRYRVVAMVLELGIVVHSIVIGLGVGASNDVCTIKPLVAALCFHQMFEGMGLGGCILQADYKMVKRTVMVFFFSITTPFGIALGIALSKTYKENSPSALITVGLLNASSAGLLIYMALVDLLSADFMGPKLQGSIKLQIKAYAAVLLGAGTELKGVIGIATILIASIIGVCLPLITQSVPALSPNRSLFVIIKAFASGFILATAFMIVLTDSYGMLSSNCLADVPWHKFPFTSFVAMVSAIFTLMVDSMVTSMYTNKKKNEKSESSELAAEDQERVITIGGEMHSHGHHHRQKGTIGQQFQRYHVVAMMLELGIVVHSIVIGLGLGASNDTCTIKSLVAALCFHQLFEGMGLGSVGLLNASSSGILIYMALANLLSADFMGPKLQGSIKLQIMAYTAVFLGAGGLSLMANGLTAQLSSQSIFKKHEFGSILTNRERGISFIAL
ncbi:probable zinc transporter 10 [Tanacetum coccineum]